MQTKVSHTPGQWAIENGVVTAKGALVSIAEIHDHSDISADWNETGANARLIASAPDLLAACEAMIKGASFVHDGVSKPDPKAYNAAIRGLYDAIAKARGEA